MSRFRLPTTAAGIGILATLVAVGVLALSSSTITPLEWTVHEHWARPSRSASPALVIIARDSAREARLGAGAWDRAVLARLIAGLSRAGAAAIGVDVALERPSAPGRGGAASDALLSQAISLAGDVVVPVALELAADRPGSLSTRSWLP